VAAYLDASLGAFPVDLATVKTMWNSVVPTDNGYAVPNTTIFWDRAKVMDYLDYVMTA